MCRRVTSRFALLAFQGARVEKDLRQFPCAKNPLQFAESDERDKHHEQEHCESENSPPGTAAEIGDPLVEGLVAIEADDSFFQKFETSQNNGK